EPDISPAGDPREETFRPRFRAAVIDQHDLDVREVGPSEAPQAVPQKLGAISEWNDDADPRIRDGNLQPLIRHRLLGGGLLDRSWVGDEPAAQPAEPLRRPRELGVSQIVDVVLQQFRALPLRMVTLVE